jgi:hypothetical protein
MTLSPDDLAAMGERHIRGWGAANNFVCYEDHFVCYEDHQSWPCDSRRLLDEVEALREACVLGLRALDWEAGDDDQWNTGVRARMRNTLSEEVMTQTANEPST